MRAVIYARFSTDLQSAASIEDQVRVCQRLIEGQGWTAAQIYSDMGMSGASHLRPGYQKLLEDARARAFDVVVAESIDRISRDQEHIAAFHKQMSFQGIPVFTVAEGAISELHIGLKGTMSALFLKDLAQKTHRGLEGRVRQGKAAGGISYGYRLERALQADGTFTTGERSINPDEATIVRRIFAAFAEGKSPRAIAAMLNKDGIPWPSGTAWGASTIYGNWRRGTGLLNNELCMGKLVWNRQRFVKDPATGKRQARPNPPEAWIIEDVPDLRIVDDALWEGVKVRQQVTRDATGLSLDRRPERARRPQYLFSGMLQCGCCGGGFTLIGKTRYGCATARNKGTCDNRRTIERTVLEDRVLGGLKDRLLHPDLIAEFVAEYQREYTRLTRETRAARASAERELAQVQRKIDQIVEAVCGGLFHASMKDKLTSLEGRKAALTMQLQEPQEELIALHPGLAEVYRRKVGELTTALNAEGTKTEATELLRGLLSGIRLIPEGTGLAIELTGELAGIMALGEGRNDKTPAQGGGSGRITMVAGAGYNEERTGRELRLAV